MKTVLTLISIYLLTYLTSYSQDTISNKHNLKPLRPLSEEDIYKHIYKDKIDSTYIEWTKKQISEEIRECIKDRKDEILNAKEFCNCAVTEVSQVVNYERYSTSSDYQKGRIAGQIAKGKCSMKKK